MKRVLVVSPHFPPINAPDMQRVRMSLPYYRALGWEPVVLTVAAAEVGGVEEPELMATVPPEVRIVTCRAWSRKWTRYLGIGTLGLRSVVRLYAAGAALLRREKFDLVLFSNTQFTTFPLGRLWRARFGVPYVLDLQDPWRTDYYQRKGSRRPPGGWKYQFARLQARLLEGWTFRRASGVMSVSPDYVADLRQRYPEIANTPAEVIRFGASRDDLEAARRLPASAHRVVRRPGEIHVVYTGAAGPIVPHAATVLFDAVREYRRTAPERAMRLRFHFFGTSYVAPSEGRPSILPIAEKCGVADLVEEVPHRLGHLECIRLQSEADVLLLPGSSDLAYSPSKTYPYYLSGNPVLALVFRGSVLERLVDELGGAWVVRFDEAAAKSEAHAALHRFFDAAVTGRAAELLAPRNDATFAREYFAEELTRRQCALFERATALPAGQLGQRRG